MVLLVRERVDRLGLTFTKVGIEEKTKHVTRMVK